MQTPSIFFITKCLLPRRPALAIVQRDLVVSSLRHSVDNGRIELGAFVVMPDHWHALAGLCPPWTLPRWMHALMSFVGAKTGRFLRRHGTGWEDGYYDTEIRTGKQFYSVQDYIINNPVKKGLVRTPAEWKHSSAYPGNSPWATLRWPPDCP